MTEHPPSYPPPAYSGPIDPSWPPPYIDEEPLDYDPAPLLMDVVTIVGSLLVLSVACGAIWAAVVTPAQLIHFDGAVARDMIQYGAIFGMDGWYAAIGGAAGLSAGLALGLWRRRDPLATLVLLMAGCALAAVVMRWTGTLLGPTDPTSFLQTAPIGTSADGPIDVTGAATYLAWPIPALIGNLIALVSRTD
ncbi:MAG TPA: hypothetical protein VLI04_10035 [Nocardioidaceae bacterium]|nr:hypothetical protein [Nocardioidaceae bacterium]